MVFPYNYKVAEPAEATGESGVNDKRGKLPYGSFPLFIFSNADRVLNPVSVKEGGL